MITMLDCTLRDGAYIVDSMFGESAIKGIISKLKDAHIDIIECGWLKNSPHVAGSTFYHVPSDLLSYIGEKDPSATYVVMIDWDRYDLDFLPENDGRSIDAVRIVFPYGKHKEGIEVGRQILAKGYKVFFQAANTLAYNDDDLKDLAECINATDAEGLSVVDTFGAMYEEDLDRIVTCLDKHLNPAVKLGFHSHNNQQLAFSNSIHFIKLLKDSERDTMIDSSLCGMGRGAGNATTELIVNYLNSHFNGNYDFDSVMDAIDLYISGFQQKFKWGYSTAYYIAGIYCCHVNNIAYLQDNHRTNNKDMRNIIESLSPADRRKYDYDLLEEKYIENQDRLVDDDEVRELLKSSFKDKVLLVAPGRSSLSEIDHIREFIEKENPTVIAVNALLSEYIYDYLFLTNRARYEYASTVRTEQFNKTPKILLSNIKTTGESDEYIINFNRAIKRGWKHFDNAVICCLRLLNKLGVKDVYLAGFDGFSNVYNESYADQSLPTLNPEGKWEELNEEIKDMFRDVKVTTRGSMQITFVTASIYDQK